MKDLLTSLLADGTPPVLSETQARLTEAALAVFAERGYDGATTAAIARRAGLTEKTLFKHFPSKTNLFARSVYPAVLQFFQPMVFEELRLVLAQPPTRFHDALVAIISERLAFARAHPEILKLLAQELLLREEFREPFLAFWKAQLLPGVLDLLRLARVRGDIRELPDEAVLRTLISLTVGQALQYAVFTPARDSHSDETAVAVLVDILLNGIGVTSGTNEPPLRPE